MKHVSKTIKLIFWKVFYYKRAGFLCAVFIWCVDMAAASNDVSTVFVDEDEINLVLLFESHSNKVISDEELIVGLEILERAEGKVYQYWNIPRFDLNSMTDDECLTEFRFRKSDIERLCVVMKLPEFITTYNRHNIPSIEALCILLKRLAYPCRYYDMIGRFGRSKTMLCIIFNHVLDFVYDKFSHLLTSFDQNW